MTIEQIRSAAAMVMDEWINSDKPYAENPWTDPDNERMPFLHEVVEWCIARDVPDPSDAAEDIYKEIRMTYYGRFI